MIAVTVVFALGYQGGRIVCERLLLGGIAIGTLLGSAQTVMLLFADEERVQGALNQPDRIFRIAPQIKQHCF